MDDKSSAGRLVGVLISPVATFRAIAQRPTWVVPLVFLLVVSLGNAAVLLQKVDREQFRQQMVEQMERRGQTPSDAQLDTMEKFALPCGTAFGIGISLLFYFAGSGILLAAANALGGQIDYRTSLAVLLHAMIPLGLLSLLSIPVALGRESLTVPEMQQGGGLLPSSLAVLAPEGAGPRLLALLGSFDLFTIWAVVLLILGYHLAARLSKGAAAAVVLSLWAVAILAKVGLASLSGAGS